MSDVKLPAVRSATSTMLDELVDSLGVPREILASDEEIQSAWRELPRELTKIPAERRNELLARMCVAVAVGLFDSAVNYAWNTAILELRNRVRAFGLHVVPQIIGEEFDEKALLDLKDAELLSLSLSLNLITEDGYFLLNQCREVRNNFSAAHPPIGTLDDREIITFLSRCAKYALADTTNPRGVDTHAFLQAIKGSRFDQSQEKEWSERLAQTHEAQREMLFGALHGIYCDPASSEEARLNALAIAQGFSDRFTPTVKAQLVDRHCDYSAHGRTAQLTASRQFFEKLGMLALLSDTERHAIISHASKQLLSVHRGWDNFYNEPPFAERLLDISRQGPIPESVQSEYVKVVVTCAVGNQYGVSFGASKYYEEMIGGFSPKEIVAMLEAPDQQSILAHRIKNDPTCRKRFGHLLALIDPVSVPTSYRTTYDSWRNTT